jgi:hypothetical protein
MARSRSSSPVGNAHDAECLLVAPHVAIQPLAQGQRIEPVVFDSLAPFVPFLRLHDEVGRAHRFKPSMQMIPKRSRLLTGVDPPGQRLLPGDKEQQLLKCHLLGRLRRGAIDLTADVLPLGMRVDAALDRFVWFAGVRSSLGCHRFEDRGFSRNSTTSCRLAA